jgi:hypothetical protein
MVIGGVILAVVFGLNLFPRLDDGGTALHDLQPAFRQPRVAGTAAGVAVISDAVQVANPLMTPSGGGASEAAHLVKFLSLQTGLSEAQVLAAVSARFPHLAGLLQALPLSSVSAELPGLEALLASLLHVTPAQLAHTLSTDFPALYQAIANLPTVTSGWNDVPGMAGLTTFSGAPVTSVPEFRTYVQKDVVPVLATQRTNFDRLHRDWPPVAGIPIWLAVEGAVIALLGLVMVVRWRKGLRTRRGGVVAVVPLLLLGLLIFGFVFGFGMYSRLDGGQELLDEAAPAFTVPRVNGTAAGVAMVAHVAGVVSPIVTPAGGAAAEVPKLLDTVATATGLSPTQVLDLLTLRFPHVAGLLQAIPLTSVQAELPGFEAFASHLLKLPTPEVLKAVRIGYPGLYQAISYLPKLTSQWYAIPHTAGMTMFAAGPDAGAAVHAMPQFVQYLSKDLVPAVAAARPDVEVVATTSPPLTAFPPALTVAGGLITLYSVGIIVLLMARVPEPAGAGELVDEILEGRRQSLRGSRDGNMPDDLVASILT